MRYVYSVVRFVPDPAREEFINVGVILGSEESSEWLVRQIENLQRARWLDERGSLPAVWGFLDRIGRSFDDYEDYLERLAETTLLPSEEWRRTLHEEHRNEARSDHQGPVDSVPGKQHVDGPAAFSAGFSTCPAPVGPVENSEPAGHGSSPHGVENAK